MKVVAGATTLAELASALGCPGEEASVVSELKSGSESAYDWLIAHYHQPVYSLVYRMVNDPADAADTTQEVFLKVFRGMKGFDQQSSLKTWIYRIAVHEACNRKRWWFRHKGRETSLDAGRESELERAGMGLAQILRDPSDSPFERMAHEEVRAKVEMELRQIPEAYRSTVVLRDLEGLSYDEIAEITRVSLGTVKSRLMRGREALKVRLQPYVDQLGTELGIGAEASAAAACGQKNLPQAGHAAFEVNV